VIPHIQKNTIEFVRLSRLYTACCSAHPALAGYPTLDAVLSSFDGPGAADPPTRRRVICAVIAEHQSSPSPLWGAILLHAFHGMLVHLSRSLVGIDPDEADAQVMAGLLEGLRWVRPGCGPEHIAVSVRQETRRAVFAALRRDARAGQYRDEDEEPPHGDGESPAYEEVVDDDWSDEPPRDPLALQRASRRLGLDGIADPESCVPLEERMVFHEPTVDGIPDETLLRAQAVRGGLRRLTNHVFEQTSARDRERMYRQLVRRTKQLMATTK
jgi:hypothetical protein